MGPDKETVITVTASSILCGSLAHNNCNLMYYIKIDVDVDADDGAADTRKTPV
jgi:hypothetical protein